MVKNKILISLFALSFSSIASAGIISGGTYLDNTSANQLETWLGVGDQDFTNVWSGTIGDTSASFHTAVDGIGATFSIFEMTIWDGSTQYIGGYTDADWGGTGYTFDADAFLFNLSTNEVQYQDPSNSSSYGYHSIYSNNQYFATFGGGHDLFGGYLTLGNNAQTNSWYDGYTYSYTYDHTQGQISVAGDSGYGYGNSGHSIYAPSITGLQVFTINDAATVATVPEPSVIALFAAGLVGLGFARRRRHNLSR